MKNKIANEPMTKRKGGQNMVKDKLGAAAASALNGDPTSHRYPTHWVVSIPTLSARLRVEPWVREQEVVSPIGKPGKPWGRISTFDV